MKTIKLYLRFFALVVVVIAGQSCNQNRDGQGRLLSKYITTNTGGLNFTPMMRSDSASVAAFKPDTFFYKDKPYTGAFAQYNQNQNLIIEGYIKNGLMDSTWKFYFASGGVRMEGNYKDGIDIGIWHSYYGYNKPKITKLYDNHGYMLMRTEYYDNGRVKNYQNIHAPIFGNKARHYEMGEHGETISIYVEDSVFMDKQGENDFTRHQGTLDIAK